MPFYSCRICQPDGSALAENVRVSIEAREPTDTAEWYGTLTITHLTQLDAGRRYRLVLDDGRTGEFVVRRNTFAGGVDRAVAIVGAGPLS